MAQALIARTKASRERKKVSKLKLCAVWYSNNGVVQPCAKQHQRMVSLSCLSLQFSLSIYCKLFKKQMYKNKSTVNCCWNSRLSEQQTWWVSQISHKKKLLAFLAFRWKKHNWVIPSMQYCSSILCPCYRCHNIIMYKILNSQFCTMKIIVVFFFIIIKSTSQLNQLTIYFCCDFVMSF